MAEPRKRWFGDFRTYEGKTLNWSDRKTTTGISRGVSGWRREGDRWVQYSNGKKTGRTSKTRLGTTNISAKNPDQWEKKEKKDESNSDKKKNRTNLNTPSKTPVSDFKDTGHTKLVKGDDGQVRRVKVSDKTKDRTLEGSDTSKMKQKPTTKSKKSNVFTKHYKTGKALGVMSRRERRAYDKEAAGRTFKGEVAKHEKKSGHGQSHKRETLYKSSLNKKKRKQLMVTNEKDTGPTKLIRGSDGNMRRVKA